MVGNGYSWVLNQQPGLSFKSSPHISKVWSSLVSRDQPLITVEAVELHLLLSWVLFVKMWITLVPGGSFPILIARQAQGNHMGDRVTKSAFVGVVVIVRMLLDHQHRFDHSRCK